MREGTKRNDTKRDGILGSDGEFLAEMRLERLPILGKLFDSFVELVKGHLVLEEGPAEFGFVVDERDPVDFLDRWMRDERGGRGGCVIRIDRPMGIEKERDNGMRKRGRGMKDGGIMTMMRKKKKADGSVNLAYRAGFENGPPYGGE